jgi:hypothetical protein
MPPAARETQTPMRLRRADLLLNMHCAPGCCEGYFGVRHMTVISVADILAPLTSANQVSRSTALFLVVICFARSSLRKLDTAT